MLHAKNRAVVGEKNDNTYTVLQTCAVAVKLQTLRETDEQIYMEINTIP